MSISQVANAPSCTSTDMPTARGLPLIGCLPWLIFDRVGFFDRARKTYGDLYRLDFGFGDFVVLGHARHAQHVMVDHADIYTREGGSFWNALRQVLGNGLVTTDGPFWMRQRRMMQPHFTRRKLGEFADAMVTCIDESIATWPTRVDAQDRLSLLPAFSDLTARVGARTMFGDAAPPDMVEKLLPSITSLVKFVLEQMALESLPRFIPRPGRARVERMNAVIDEAVYRIIGEARRARNSRESLLGKLINSVDDKTQQHMDDRQLRDEVASLFLASFETTSIALTWAFEVLARRPEIQSRVMTEIDHVLGKRLPTYADITQLKYTRMVFEEAMRLYPPVWQLSRVAQRDDVIDGHAIKAGTTVVILIQAIQRHADYWPDPDTFDPERFREDRAATRPKLAHMPFGAGGHFCIGREFALLEAPLAIARVLQRYRLEPGSKRPAKPEYYATMRPKRDTFVKLVAREQVE
jgi:cytochrome P450